MMAGLFGHWFLSLSVVSVLTLLPLYQLGCYRMRWALYCKPCSWTDIQVDFAIYEVLRTAVVSLGGEFVIARCD